RAGVAVTEGRRRAPRRRRPAAWVRDAGLDGPGCDRPGEPRNGVAVAPGDVTSMPKVALSDVFLESLNRLSDVPQKKVREFIRKFEADSTSNAINYERLQGHRNHHVRTVRIDQKYRAVVLHPDKGDVCVMMWVDDHDKAMDWAKRRAFEVNPRTGALQFYCVEEVSQPVPAEDGGTVQP